MKLIVGQCALYIAQNSICSIYYDCIKVLIEKVLCMCLVWVCTIILLYYVCVSHVYWEWYLKGHRTIQLTLTLLFILIDCIYSIDPMQKD